MIRWQPLKEFEDWQERMRQDVEELENRMNRWFGRAAREREAIMPAVDVSEDEKNLHFEIHLPGIDKDNIRVTIEDDTLSVKAERKREKKEEGKTYLRTESSYGVFFRSFRIPAGYDMSKIQANFKNGILQLDLPKTPEAKPKTVEVKVA